MKKFKKLAIVGIMSMLLSTSVFAAGKLPKDALDKNINIYINNNLQSIPEGMGRAYLDKNTNRVMVPIRYISENLGAQINFYQRKETNTSGILIGAIDVLVELDINSTKAKLNLGGEDSVVNLDSPAILYDGRTYVPIRFISETLGLNVDWKDDSVYISGKFKTKGKRYNYEEDNKEEEIKKENTADKYLDQFNIPREKVQEGKESNSIFQ
ncbi:copper amine oxidase N-terminal domain-containing protein [Peptoniphilus sp. HMSC062D09]|uniref:copper amine oxidase N-terminal domain-containing protein n=1 Tax=Peptoniphilus TaxID=162289 RepID=UPI0008A2C057|nr:copper amine oxidase N-terminal domain-containing protein [Peptoniphilus sp. HMSC062D09]OFK83404.1 copper amine oxidase [Peptoniphilus sp. HMSC062D09]